MRSVLFASQAVLVVACVVASFVYNGQGAAVAAAYGGGVAIVSTWLLANRVSKAGELAKTNPQHSVYSLYFGAIQRFILVLVALGVGMGALKLLPIPMLASFAIAQLAYMFAAGREAA